MILDDLVTVTKKRIAIEERRQPLEYVKNIAENSFKKNPKQTYDQFLSTGMHIIGEIKKASPSKGTIVKDFPYLSIAKDYDQAGVTAISVLTEPDYFKGNLEYLKEIVKEVKVPVLRKDFIINPYMIYQAKAAGASIILLIVAILDNQQLNSYLKLAHHLGLAAIVEAHDEDEVKRALDVGAKMIGVNNRNLKNFTVSFVNCINLRPLVPKSIAFIAESGIKSIADIHELKSIGVNGVLIGETLMKSPNRKELIAQALQE